jgi:photosystem II stability/assembly factor-like uncharacterized protein
MRRWTAGVACGLTLAACTSHPATSQATGSARPTPPPTSVSSSPSSAAPAVTTASPSASQVPDRGIFPTDLVFTSARDGWAIAQPDSCASRCPLVVMRTVDGGHSWRRVWSKTPLPDDAWQAKLFFADDRNGWILDRRLFATHDGGHTWHLVARSGRVLAVATGDPGQPVLLLRSGPRGTDVLRSPASHDRWTPAGTTLSRIGPGVWFSRDGDHVYVVRFNRVTGRGSLEQSGDGGTTFHRRVDPCGDSSFNESVTRGPDGSVWFVCATEPGAGQQRKKAYVSTDDGRSWTALPEIKDMGYINFMTFTSATRGLLMMNRSPLLLTTDRGVHWRAVVLRQDEGFFTAGGWFGDMAYALTARAVWITNDGGRHWWEHPFGPP